MFTNQDLLHMKTQVVVDFPPILGKPNAYEWYMVVWLAHLPKCAIIRYDRRINNVIEILPPNSDVYEQYKDVPVLREALKASDF